MKTTIDIADDLLRRAKALAQRERTTLRALAEEGLRKVLSERQRPDRSRHIRIRSVQGEGLAPEAQGRSWQSVIEEANERPHDWR